jgi:hypothetical protein
MYGQLNLATILGAMFQNAIIPLGVDGGTRSRAAERMITYKTNRFMRTFPGIGVPRLLTVIDKSEQKERQTKSDEVSPLSWGYTK